MFDVTHPLHAERCINSQHYHQHGCSVATYINSILSSISVCQSNFIFKGDSTEGEKESGIQIQVPTPVPEPAPSPSKVSAAVSSRSGEAEGRAPRAAVGMEDLGSADSVFPSGKVRQSVTSTVAGDDREGKDRGSEETPKSLVHVEARGAADGTDFDHDHGRDRERDRERDRDRRTDCASPSEPVLTPRPPVSTLVLSLEPPISPSKQTG